MEQRGPGGAGSVTLADRPVRVGTPVPAALPLGVLTALVGTPVLVRIVRRQGVGLRGSGLGLVRPAP